ncbi:phosphatase PAP2 family protein [Diaphorobacter sp.]|uniref:phosphatase PAP2 family protein n=1 Tax=Diaphorobacter sp. TaxID=1934310 RepID=UPI003D0B97DA
MALFAGINGAAGPWQDRLAIQLTLLGVGYPVMILLLAADPRGGLGPALALRTLIVAALLTRALKPLLAYPRPLGVLDPHLVHVAGSPVAASNALPSGHTLTAFAGALALWWIWRGTRTSLQNPRTAAWSLLGLLVAAMGVAWSRIAIGAHWPADVIAGAGFGMLAACLACWWEHHGRWAPRLAGPRAQRLVAAAEAALVAVFWVLSYLEGDAWWPLRIAIGLIGLASALRRWRASTRNNRGNDQATAGTARGDHAPETEHQPPTTA